MKKSFLLFLLLLVSQFVYGQSKFDEYERLDSDSESARLDNFLVALQQQPETGGLIVIYSGNNDERIGNITAYIEGAKRYMEYRGINHRISFSIGEGKTKLYKELWILPDDTKKPPIESKEINLNNLKGRILYASSCIGCDPATPDLRNDGIDFESYLKVLSDNLTYKSLIVIHRSDNESGKDHIKNLRNLGKKLKIDSKRIQIKFVKDRIELARADFYLISENKK